MQKYTIFYYVRQLIVFDILPSSYCVLRSPVGLLQLSLFNLSHVWFKFNRRRGLHQLANAERSTMNAEHSTMKAECRRKSTGEHS